MRSIKEYLSLFRAPAGPGQGAVRGGFLIIIERVAMRALGLVKTFVIARTLFPADVGLFAMASLAQAATESLFQTGFTAALVQHEGDVKKKLDAIWTLNVIRAFIVSVILVIIAAPLGGRFFHEPNVISMIRMLAVMVLINGFENVGMSMLQRELRFGRMFIYDVGGVAAQVIAIIAGALVLKNAWALVMGSIVGRAVYCILSYAIHSYRPRFTSDFGGLGKIFSFSKWMWISGVVAFLVGQGDNVVVGRLMNPSALAIYSMAFGLGLLPAIELGKAFGSILFPVYARIQSDRERLKFAFTRVAGVLAIIVLPASVGLAVLGEYVVRYIYGTRWLGIIPVLYVIIGVGLLRTYDYITNPLFLSVGLPRIQTTTQVIGSVTMLGLIIPMVHRFGVTGAGFAALAGSATATAYISYELYRVFRPSIADFWNVLSLPFLSSAIMAILILTASRFISINSSAAVFVYAGVGAAVYFFCLFLTDHLSGRRVRSAVLWVRSNI